MARATHGAPSAHASPPADLVAEVRKHPPAASSDKLDALRLAASAARSLRSEVTDLTERLEDAKKRYANVMSEVIPEMMDAVGVPRIDLDAVGNFPAVAVEVKPYFSANIAAKWPADKKTAAYRWLDDNGAGDLIKTTVVLRFPREERAAALELASKLRKSTAAEVEVAEAVSSQTLTAWLKETVRSGRALPPLDVIGGHVGRVATMKERDQR